MEGAGMKPEVKDSNGWEMPDCKFPTAGNSGRRKDAGGMK
jgi:hypothetical protein